MNDLSGKHPTSCKCKCHQIKLFAEGNGNTNHQSTNETGDQSTSKCRAVNTDFLDVNNKAVMSRSNSNTTNCSVCNRKIAGSQSETNNADGANLNDSTIFYSSVGVQGLGKANFEGQNNHDFYCYSAKDAAALFDDDDDDNDESDNADGAGGFDANVNDIDGQAAAALKRKRRQEAKAAAQARRRRSVQTHTQICCYMCCFCCSRRLEKSKCCILLDRFNKLLRRFVDCSFFQRTILCAILINTISMGIEHHQQVNSNYLFNKKLYFFDDHYTNSLEK